MTRCEARSTPELIGEAGYVIHPYSIAHHTAILWRSVKRVGVKSTGRVRMRRGNMNGSRFRLRKAQASLPYDQAAPCTSHVEQEWYLEKVPAVELVMQRPRAHHANEVRREQDERDVWKVNLVSGIWTRSWT